MSHSYVYIRDKPLFNYRNYKQLWDILGSNSKIFLEKHITCLVYEQSNEVSLIKNIYLICRQYSFES